MEASNQTARQIERALRRVIAKFPPEAEPVMTDLHLLVSGDTGEIRIFDDDDRELDRCDVEEWKEQPADTFRDDVAPLLRRSIESLRGDIARMSVMQPFSFVLIDEDHETLQDLAVIDSEETVVLDTTLLEGLGADLDAFLERLLEE